MRNRGLVCISLIGCALVLAGPAFAERHANRALRNLLAATGHPRLGTIQTYLPDPADTPNEWNGPSTGLAFIDRALSSFNLTDGANYFMQGSQTNGGMAITVNHASYPGRGFVLDLKWQLGQ